MVLEKTVLVILTTALPISELRGGIPLALSFGFNPISAFLLTVFINSILFFPIFFGLKLFYENFLSRIKIFRKYLERVRIRGEPLINKYGVIGLAIFVSLPLPMSGVYSGSVLSWLLGFSWKKAFFAIMIGVVTSGLIVLGMTLGVFTSIAFLTK